MSEHIFPSAQPVLERHLPLITPRVDFDLAILPSLPTITPRTHFEKLPKGATRESALYNSNGKRIRPDVKKPVPSPKARQQAYIASQSASDTSSDESDSAHDQQSSATSITAPDSKQDLKPAASTKDDFQLITSPALFKQTYKHLKELLQQHGWKEAEAEAFVVYVKDICATMISMEKMKPTTEELEALSRAAEGRFPKLWLFDDRWPLALGIATAYRLHHQSVTNKEKRQASKQLALVRR